MEIATSRQVSRIYQTPPKNMWTLIKSFVEGLQQRMEPHPDIQPPIEGARKELRSFERDKLDSELFNGTTSGDVPRVRSAINKGANVNIGDPRGVRLYGWNDKRSALMIAAQFGYKETVELLIEHGANVNAQSLVGWTALIHAVFEKHIEIVNSLLRHEADPNIKDNNGQTALAFVCNIEIATALLANGAEVDARDKNGLTPLMHASRKYGSYEGICELLIEKGANVNSKDNRGATALMHAAEVSSVTEIVESLIANGAKTNIRDDANWTALMYAVRSCINGGSEKMRIIRSLIRNDADVNAENNSGETALDIAVTYEYDSVAGLLKQCGAHY